MGSLASCPCSTRTEEKARDSPSKPTTRRKKAAEESSEPASTPATPAATKSIFEEIGQSAGNAVQKATEAIAGESAASTLEQNTDIPTIDEIKLCFALATAAYLGDDIAPEEHYSPALFDPKTGEPVPKEIQEQGLGPCLKSAFGLTMDHFMNIASSDTQGFIAHDDDTIILCYRGSMQAADWVTNAQTNVVPWKPFEHGEHAGHAAFLEALSETKPGVHEGHYNAFLTSKAVIQEHFLPQVNAVTKPTKVIICGHSLGGSLANMALVYILEAIEDAHKEGLIELCFCTIGAPRTGNMTFVLHALDLLLPWEEADKVRIGRFVNKSDIVPYSTPAAFYRHLRRANLLTETGEAHLHDGNDGVSEDDFVKGKVSPNQMGDRVKDHLTGAYRDVMFKCEESLRKIHEHIVAKKDERRSVLLELEHMTEEKLGIVHEHDDVQMTPNPTPQRKEE